MKHSQVDEFARRSPLSLVDPRAKLIALIAFLAVAAISTQLEATFAVLVSSLIVAAISMVPARHLASLSAISIPFIVAAALAAIFVGSPENGALLSMRIFASVLAAVVFSCTTPLFEQVGALQFFHVPKVITSTVLFAHRFIFVFVDELERMRLARKARGFDGGRHLLDRGAMGTISNTIGMLFIRVSERAGRVFDSLSNRGYNGAARVNEGGGSAGISMAYTAMIASMAFLALAIQMGVVECRLL